MLRGFMGKKPKIHKTAYIADTAEIIGEVAVGKDSSIWHGVVLRGDMHYIKVGKGTSIQDNSVMHGTATRYPTVVGDHVSIGHNALVHGCKIGNNCIVGMGAIILEGAEIGDWCIVGAGAVVTEGKKIPSNSIVLGLPAKVIGKISKEHKERITRNWKAYVSLKDKYLDEKQP